MAAAKSEDVIDSPLPPPAAQRKGGGLVLVLAAVLLSTLGGGGAAWFVAQHALAAAQPKGEEDAEEKVELPSSPAQYFALEPAFVVNLEDERAQRFLQVQVELMSRDGKTLEQIERHAPRIRSQLLMLLGQQQVADLSTRAGKEALQAAVLAEVKAILMAETGEAQVEAVYFTSFVMQ